MLKLFGKKRIFVFLISLVLTVFVGYFAWGALVHFSGIFVSKVLSYTDKIGATLFTALISGPAQIQEIIPAVSVETPEDVEVEVQEQVVIKESLQDQLDNIAEKLDVIASQVAELMAEQSVPEQEEEILEEEEEEKEIEEETFYPQILISQAQAYPIEQRFIALHNLNDEAVDLTGWYLQRKTATSDSWSSLVSVSNFNGKKILPNSYFVISRTGASADIFFPGLTITENNTLALKNPNGEISSTFYTPAKIVSGEGGGGTSVPDCEVAVNIIITEFQVEGESVNDDWVELYNPNENPVCLNGWSIQKASSTGRISRVKIFSSSAIIPAKIYYLVVNSRASQELLELADMTASGLQLSSEFAGGNTIYLVAGKDEISDGSSPEIIDKVGYGMAKDFKEAPALKPSAGRSTGRIWDDNLGEYKNTGNNSADFEIDTPTPKSQNVKWVEPPAPTLVSIEIITPADKLNYIIGDELNITGLVITGTYSNGNTQIEIITLEDITGFNNSASIESQILTITIGEQSTTYTVNINPAPTLQSIEITTPPSKIDYFVGDTIIDITGLVITGNYSDGTSQIETITLADVTGFDSSLAVTDQVLTITIGELTTTYTIDITEPVDTTPPEVSFSLDAIQNTLEFSVNFTITDIADFVSPSGLANYIFRWSEDGDNWQEDAVVEIGGDPSSTAFARDFVGEDGKTYYFQVQATDVAENESLWLPDPSAQTKIQLPIIAENILTNEFFSIWSSGLPDDWLWTGASGNINQSVDKFEEDYSTELNLTTLNNRGLYQYGKTMNSNTTYYTEVWVKGMGIASLCIKYPNSDTINCSNETVFNNVEWTKISHFRKPSNSGDNGGIRLNVKYDDAEEIPSGSKLLVGAAWLGIAEPPEGWHLQ